MSDCQFLSTDFHKTDLENKNMFIHAKKRGIDSRINFMNTLMNNFFFPPPFCFPTFLFRSPPFLVVCSHPRLLALNCGKTCIKLQKIGACLSFHVLYKNHLQMWTSLKISNDFKTETHQKRIVQRDPKY